MNDRKENKMKKRTFVKRSILIMLTVLLAASFTACGKEPEPKAITVTDQTGREVTLEKQPERIVSGYYISTSACIALDLKDRLVGIETGSGKRPIYSLAAPELMTEAVDVGSAKNFDIEACIAAEPDLVILPMKARDYADTLTELGIAAIVVNPESQEALEEMISLIACITGVQPKAEELLSFYASVSDKIDTLTAQIGNRPVVYMSSADSPFTTVSGSSYQGNLLSIAGGVNAGDVLQDISGSDIDYEQFLSMDPEYIIIPANSMANGYGYEISEFTDRPEFANVKAVADGNIYLMPIGLESWDSPVPSGILGTLWTFSVLHPDLLSMEEVTDISADFYRTFYGFEIDRTLIK